MSLFFEIGGRLLRLLAGTTAQIEHINPLFADGIEDGYSLPLELPAEGNEDVLAHVHQLPLHQRTLSFPNTRIGENGLPLFPGQFDVLNTNSTTVRGTFLVEALVTRLRGAKLPELLQEEVIDSNLFSFGDFLDYADGGTCRLPMYLNPGLYGDANPHWYPTAQDYNPDTGYSVNDLINFTEYDIIELTDIWQCIEDTAFGESPLTAPAKWRRAAFGIVNAFDTSMGTYYFNSEAGNYYALVPWFYLKWVIKRSLLTLGYNAIGEFMDDPRTHEMLLPNNTTLDRNFSVEGTNYFRASTTTPTYFDPDAGWRFMNVSGADETTTPNEDPSDLWNNTTMVFTPDTAGVWKFRVIITLDTRRPDTWYRPHLRFFLLDAAGDEVGMGTGFLNPGSNTTTIEMTVEITAPQVGNDFHFVVVQWLPGIAAPTWPTIASDHYVNCDISGWMQEAAPIIAYPDPLIHPHRHVPNVEILDFLIAIGDTYNLKYTPDDDGRTLRIDYRQSLLLAPEENTTDHSARMVGDVEIDHSRATPGVILDWEVEAPTNDADKAMTATRYFCEQDLPVPITNGQYALLENTRELLRSTYRDGYHYWQRRGYYVPQHLVGQEQNATAVKPDCTPLHMTQVKLDGEDFLMPTMDELGTSLWFNTDGPRDTIYLCEYKKMRSQSGAVSNIPSARTWGYGWSASDLSRQTLLWDNTDYALPGLYQNNWAHWLEFLTRAEPVTMDLLLDAPFLRGKQWHGILHIHSQNYLLARMPVEYGTAAGQLISRGAYLYRMRQPIRPLTLVAPPPFVCAGPGYVPIQVDEAGGAVYFVTTSGYFTLRSSVDESVTTYESATTVSDLDAGTYCAWPSDAAGNYTGEYTALGAGFGAISIFDIAGLAGTGPFQELVFDTAAITTYDIPYLLGATQLYVITTPLVTLTIDANTLFEYINIVDCALSEASVINVINAAYASALAGVLTTVDIHGGTSASPPSSVDDLMALLTGTADMQVVGAGATEANGAYTLTTAQNGRDAYVHSNGSEIYWSGTHWNIESYLGDTYRSAEDHAQPWRVTAWYAFGAAPGPDPTVTPPGFGLTITTN